MSGQSSVGSAGVYEASDQRTASASETNKAERFAEGKENSHQANDSKDERTIANRLAAAEDQNDDSSGKEKSAETKAAEVDPTLPAKMHGNEPSRGAKIDKEIEEEEKELLRKKDGKGKN